MECDGRMNVAVPEMAEHIANANAVWQRKTIYT